MRFVESIRSKLLPIAPYLLQGLWVMPILLTLFDELGLHRIYYGFLLFSHGFAESIALTTGEIGQLSR